MNASMPTVRVKICGITNLADAVFASEAGADLIGFILTEKSPRYIDPSDALSIVNELNNHCHTHQIEQPKRCGVFVNADPQRVQWALDQGIIDYAQLHGDEPSGALAALHGRAYKAIRPKMWDEDTERSAMQYARLGVMRGPSILLDAYSSTAYGGTGELTDWTVAAQLAKATPGLVLAGGLTAVNVVDAVRQVKPWAVDVSSGVEYTPGRKDHDEVKRFISAAKHAELRESTSIDEE